MTRKCSHKTHQKTRNNSYCRSIGGSKKGKKGEGRKKGTQGGRQERRFWKPGKGKEVTKQQRKAGMKKQRSNEGLKKRRKEGRRERTKE